MLLNKERKMITVYLCLLMGCDGIYTIQEIGDYRETTHYKQAPIRRIDFDL